MCIGKGGEEKVWSSILLAIGRCRKDVNLAMAGNILDWASPGVSRALVRSRSPPAPCSCLVLNPSKGKRHVPLCI